MKCLVISWCLLFYGSIYATTYFVSNTGSNSNDGLTPATAFLTIQHAVDVIAAGDSVLVADGTYTGFDVRTGGTVTDPIVFLASGDNCLINLPTGTNDGINVENADYVEINGFIVNDQPRNGIRLVNADFCVVRNNSCDGNFERGIFTGFTDDILIENNICSNSIDEHGIYVSNSSDRAIIRNNTCHGNNGSGIQINADASAGGDGTSSDCEVSANVIFNNGDGGGAGINLDGNERPLIVNNLIYGNHASGIALYQIDGTTGTTNAKVYHNTIVNASDGRWCITIVDGSTGATLRNNIFLNHHSFRGSIDIDQASQVGFDSDHNLVLDRFTTDGGNTILTLMDWQNLGFGANSVLYQELMPLFVDESSDDFHLVMGSQAINQGDETLIPPVDEDLDGTTRNMSTPDLGAYEFDGTVLAIGEDPRSEQKLDDALPSQALRIQNTPHEIIFTQLPRGAAVFIFDANGKLVMQRKIKSNPEIRLSRSAYPPGYYFYHVMKRGEIDHGVLLF